MLLKGLVIGVLIGVSSSPTADAKIISFDGYPVLFRFLQIGIEIANQVILKLESHLPNLSGDTALLIKEFIAMLRSVVGEWNAEIFSLQENGDNTMTMQKISDANSQFVAYGEAMKQAMLEMQRYDAVLASLLSQLWNIWVDIQMEVVKFIKEQQANEQN